MTFVLGFWFFFFWDALYRGAQNMYVRSRTSRGTTVRSPLRWPAGREFSFPKQYCTLFVWGDLDREQISVFDLNSDEINRSVHYVHHILEQKKRSWK